MNKLQEEYRLERWIKESDVDGRGILFQFTDSDIPILRDAVRELIAEERQKCIEIFRKMIDELEKHFKQNKQTGIIGDLSEEGLLDYKGTMKNLKEFKENLFAIE